ncbi:MAG: RNA polymerase sigma factor RpoD/SigA [bacterium]
MTDLPHIEDSALENYLKSISKTKPLKSEQEKEYCIRIRKGDLQSLHKLVNANLRFVVSVAHNYQHQGLPLTDLINEGNLGLLKAAKRFDETKGYRFISYAVWWIRQAILAALAEQSRITHIPMNVANTLYRARKFTDKFEQKYYRKPTNEEVARELRMDEKCFNQVLNVETCTSLDKKINSEDDFCPMDMLGAEDENIYKDSEQHSTISVIEEVLGTLKKKEAEIIRLYYGIGRDTSFTLDQIGNKFKLTRERIRQIKEKALKQLRHSKRSQILKYCFQ